MTDRDDIQPHVRQQIAEVLQWIACMVGDDLTSPGYLIPWGEVLVLT